VVVERQGKAENDGVGSTCQRRDKTILALRKMGGQRLQKLQGELFIGVAQLLDDRGKLLALILGARADGQQQLIDGAAIQVCQLQQLGHRQLYQATLQARDGFAGNAQVLADLLLGQTTLATILRQLAANVMWARLFDGQRGALQFDPHG